MNLKIQQLQPELVSASPDLEHKQLSHAYLFTGSFASFEMAPAQSRYMWYGESGLVANAVPAARLLKKEL